MKILLCVCLLLFRVAPLSASVSHNWYFDFYCGETVCRVSGVKANESEKTTVIERALGRYLADSFVVESKVESDSGVVVMAGSTRWAQVEDHFEGDITTETASYHGVLHLDGSKAVLELYSGGSRIIRSEYYLRRGRLYGRSDIYDAAGKVLTVCDSECEKALSRR